MQSEQQTAFKRFSGLAEEFCRIVDSAREMTIPEFLAELARNIPHLYGAGARLDDVEKENFEPKPPFAYVLAWQPLYDFLKEKLGSTGEYLEVFNPIEKEEAIPHSLADDLADIYCDLKRGFAVLEAGGPPVNAIWEWHFGFWYHWGEHAVSALRAIHYIRVKMAFEAEFPETPQA